MNDSLPNYFLLLNMIFFLWLLTLCSFIVFFIVLHVSKQASFVWIKEGRNKSSMTKKSCRFVELLNSVVTIKWCSAEYTFYRVWLNSKILKHMPFFWPTPPIPHMPKFRPTLPILKFYGLTLPMPQFQPTPPTSKFYGPTLPMPNFDPRNPQTYTI